MLIESAKGPCIICGEDDPVVIQFHHVDPEEKSFVISRSWTRYGKQRIMEELAKCICLCANCHLRVHYGTVQIPGELP